MIELPAGCAGMTIPGDTIRVEKQQIIANNSSLNRQALGRLGAIGYHA